MLCEASTSSSSLLRNQTPSSSSIHGQTYSYDTQHLTLGNNVKSSSNFNTPLITERPMTIPTIVTIDSPAINVSMDSTFSSFRTGKEQK